jgi:hypothetical protein
MIEDLVSAFVVHRTPGRLRLKIPEKRGDAGYFGGLPGRLAQCPGVIASDANVLTGSLLLFHSPETGPQEIAAYAEQTALFSIKPAPVVPRQSIADHAAASVAALDRGMSHISGGVVDVRSILLLLLAGLIVRQAFLGQIAGPVTSLLLSALELAGLDKPGRK